MEKKNRTHLCSGKTRVAIDVFDQTGYACQTSYPFFFVLLIMTKHLEVHFETENLIKVFYFINLPVLRFSNFLINTPLILDPV